MKAYAPAEQTIVMVRVPPVFPLLLLCVLPEGAVAAESNFHLAWTAPAACAAQPNVSELVGDAVGSATITIARSGERWNVVLTFTAPVEGSRTLEAETCEEAAEAALFLLRLGARGVLPPPEVAAPLVEAVVEPPTASASSAPVFLSVAAFAGGQALAAPRVELRVGALVWFGVDVWAVMVGLSTGLPQRYVGGPIAEAAVELHPVLDGTVSGCYSRAWSIVRIAGCAEVQVAWWLLRGLNVSEPHSGGTVLVALGPAARALFPLGDRLAVVAGFAVRPVMLKPQASFEGYGVALQAGPVVLGFDVGVGARW